MKRVLTIILLVAGVAATQTGFTEEEYYDPAFGYDTRDPLNPIPLDTIEAFSQYLNEQRAEIDKISSAATKQKAMIDALWQEAQMLVDGLKVSIETLNQLAAEYNEGKGFIWKTTWELWLEETYEPKIKEINESLNKKKDKDDKDDDLSDYLKKIEAQSTYLKIADASKYALASDVAAQLSGKADRSELSGKADKSTTDNHESRIYALEQRSPGGIGGGEPCENCASNWNAIAEATDGIFSAEQDETNSCPSITAEMTLPEWLGSFPLAYYGEEFSRTNGNPAVQMWDEELRPTFKASPSWAGSGLSFDGESGTLSVCVSNVVSGNLAAILDGTAEEQSSGGSQDNPISSVAVIRNDGSVASLEIGEINIGVDDETIERTAESEGEESLLRVKTGGIIDNDTITLVGGTRQAMVNVASLCDGSTIKTNSFGKLTASSSGGLVRIIGTDGSTNISADSGEMSSVAQTLTFASAEDANVVVSVSGSHTNATISIGVYYK